MMVTEYDWENDTFTHHDARSAFRATVAEVAARAKDKLPTSVNGRIESAVKLVLMHDVEPQDDGSILVGSSTDALKVYRLEGQSCTCQDFERGQAPEGWCQHRIAAGIQKRVLSLMRKPSTAPLLPEGMEPWPDTAPEPVPQSPTGETEPVAGIPVATPLPEAPASVNVRVTIGGREVQWTLRDTDESRLAARLEALLARYPAPQPASPQGQDATPQCPEHGALRQGKRGWFCPTKLDDDTWCKSKAK